MNNGSLTQMKPLQLPPVDAAHAPVVWLHQWEGEFGRTGLSIPMTFCAFMYLKSQPLRSFLQVLYSFTYFSLASLALSFTSHFSNSSLGSLLLSLWNIFPILNLPPKLSHRKTGSCLMLSQTTSTSSSVLSSIIPSIILGFQKGSILSSVWKCEGFHQGSSA